MFVFAVCNEPRDIHSYCMFTIGTLAVFAATRSNCVISPAPYIFENCSVPLVIDDILSEPDAFCIDALDIINCVSDGEENRVVSASVPHANCVVVKKSLADVVPARPP